MDIYLPHVSLLLFCCHAVLFIRLFTDDLVKIQDWDFNWKMSLNSDPTKQAKNVVFFSKKKNELDKPQHRIVDQKR